VRRVTLVPVLVCLAGLFALIALPAVYVRTQMLNEGRLADRVGAAATSAPVRSIAAQRIVDAAIDAGAEQLLAARPIAIVATQSLLDGPVSRQIARGAAKDAHALLRGDENTFVLDLGRTTALALEGLRTVAPAAAARLPAGFDPEVLRISSDEPALVTARQFARVAGWLAIVAPLLALACAIAALVLASDRRRALVQLGISFAAAGLLLLILLTLARGAAVPGAEAAPDVSAAAGALWEALLGDVGLWAQATLVAGLMLAAVASVRREERQGTVGRLLGTVQRVRQAQAPRARAARAAGMLAAAALIVWRPELALRLVALGLAVFAVSELAAVLEATSRERAKSRAARKREQQRAAAASGGGGGRAGATGGRTSGDKPGRAATALRALRTPRLALPLAAVLAIVVATTILTSSEAQLPRPAAVTSGCNGSPAYCGLYLDQLTFPGTHNSFAAAQEPGFLIPDQRYGIAQQLRDGITAFLLDVHIAVKTDRLVRTDLSAEGMDRNKVTQAIGARNVDLAERLGGRIGAGDVRGRRALYFCHTLCELGATPVLPQLRAFKAYLDDHPGTVLTFIIEPYAPPSQIARLFAEAGLTRYVATLQRDEPLPTLGQLVSSNQRLLVFAEQDGGVPPWYMPAFEWFQDTPFAASTPEELSCTRDRGEPDSPLFLVNHWISALPPSPSRNREVGDGFLDRRLDECARERGLQPNVVAVDFYESSGVVEAARRLNDASVQQAQSDGQLP
jgi:hypothetical protein